MSPRIGHAVADLRAFGGYARRLAAFLRTPLTVSAAHELVRRNLARREQRFLTLLDANVFPHPAHPYSRLFAAAGIERGDLVRLLDADGLDRTLAALLDAGVTLTLAEAKGRSAVCRRGVDLELHPRDLHNRLLVHDFDGRTGGSRSAGTNLWIDLRDLEETTAYFVMTRAAEQLERAEGVIWRPAPPGVAGIRRALIWSKGAMPVRRWFAQTRPRCRPGELRHAAFVAWTTLASRLAGCPLPSPELTPPDRPERVAHELAAAGRALGSVILTCTPSSAVRVCDAARAEGLDISGTFFTLGGEPYTEAKARVIAAVGGRADTGYHVTELGGPVGVGCSAPWAPDATHLVEDRVALVQRARVLPGGTTIQALYLSALAPFAAQVWINVEVGDYASVGRASCGCPFARVGLTRTLHDIRSYEKLSTEGMHFLGPQLIALLEDALPARFGGGTTDYQLVENEDESGRSQLTLVISPRVGPLDEAAVAAAALDGLRAAGPAERMMATILRDAGTLRVARREPTVSRGAKVLPLHIDAGARTRRIGRH